MVEVRYTLRIVETLAELMEMVARRQAAACFESPRATEQVPPGTEYKLWITLPFSNEHQQFPFEVQYVFVRQPLLKEKPHDHDVMSWDGNYERPTVRNSIMGHYYWGVPVRFHGFITDGVLHGNMEPVPPPGGGNDGT